MLVAVFSDAHANLEALTAVLTTAEARGAEALVCLGDVVGYGPDPAACVELLRARALPTVLGNHDVAVATGEGLNALPRDGHTAALLHRRLLTEEQRAWLGALPLRLNAYGAVYVHASPDEPAAWHRLDGFRAVRAQFAAFEGPLCFVGHSHRPAVVADRVGVLRVRPGHRFLVDVGSVGQPRDGDPRAAFALYDSAAFTCEIVRVPYDVEATAEKIRAAGLPHGLADRLRKGR
ncbi:MAG TPA: metallophosphoesterase family protein [Rubricoccaceae bacterium]|nr:metallophosphoesterase family protein [Rubricoccaceae bacterium]